MKKDIITHLLKYNTPIISDALDACGVQGYLEGIKAISSAKTLVGLAYTVKYKPMQGKKAKFNQASNYIDEVPKDSVIVIDNMGLQHCSVWGGILSHFAHTRNIAGTIVNGMVRDIHTLNKLDYSLFAIGVTAKTGKNRVHMSDKECPLEINGVKINQNDIIMADLNGVLVIPQALAEDVLAKANNIKSNETKIIESIDKGMSLAKARDEHHYDKPWEDS